MSATAHAGKTMKVLLIFRSPEPRTVAKAILENSYPKELLLIDIPLIQDALEYIEREKTPFDLIFFEHESSTQALMKILLTMRGNAQVIMCSSNESFFQGMEGLDGAPEFMLTTAIADSFGKILKKFSTSGKIPELPATDNEAYITINPHTLMATAPLKSDVYVMMGQGRYVRIFCKGDDIEQADLEKYLEKRTVVLFFIKKSDSAEVLQNHANQLQALADKPVVTTAEAEGAFANSSEFVRDIVSQIGFTPEAQAIAKNSVSVALKSVGSNPKLSVILTDLKGKKGRYIGTHSFMIGMVACAIAHKIKWVSAATYQKLTLAAFLHDIALPGEDLARISSLDAAAQSGMFSPEQLMMVKSHPVKGAEYAQQFNEIPADVDQIIMQHHERPNGKGFPRELSARAVAPLSALFIIAHDIVDFAETNPDMTVESFLAYAKSVNLYEFGQFKKVAVALAV